jgi:hypothetical protein
VTSAITHPLSRLTRAPAARRELVAGGVRPYPTIDPKHIPHAVMGGARPAFSDAAPLPYRGLAQACMAGDPRLRPTAAAVVARLQHQLQGVQGLPSG